MTCSMLVPSEQVWRQHIFRQRILMRLLTQSSNDIDGVVGTCEVDVYTEVEDADVMMFTVGFGSLGQLSPGRSSAKLYRSLSVSWNMANL